MFKIDSSNTINQPTPHVTIPTTKPLSQLHEYNYKGEHLDPNAVAFSHYSQKFGSIQFAPHFKPQNDIYRTPINEQLPRGEVAPHIIQHIQSTITTQEQYETFANSLLSDLKQHCTEVPSLDSIQTSIS